MKNILKKIVGGTRSCASAFALVLSLLAFAWPSAAQAEYEEYTKQGVMGYCLTGRTRSGDGHQSWAGCTTDVVGNYKGNWTKCTFSNAGYYLFWDGNLGSCTITPKPEFKSGGKFVKMAWVVSNKTATAVSGRIGAWCDSMIGDNDSCGIDVIKTGRGVVKGLKMVDTHSGCRSANAQLNLYFKNTADVTDCDTYWYGYYSNCDKWKFQITSQYAHSSGGYSYDANGEPVNFHGGDSALALSWNVNLQPGEAKTFSFLLGIGEKADPPEWYPDAYSDAALGLRANGRTLTSIGKATDVTTSGNIMMYAMSTPNKFEGGEKLLGTTAAAGKTTPVQLVGDIDTTGWAKGLYILDYWLVNDKGAMSLDTIRKPIQIMEDGTLNADPGDETTYLVEGTCLNADNYTNFTIRVFGIGQDPNNTGVAATNDFDAVIDSKGVFYSLLPDGHYDVVITAWPKNSDKPVTTTSLVDVEGAGTTLSVTLPTSAVDSTINDKATKFNGTMAGGLDELGAAVKGTDESITNVVVELDVVDKTESEPHAAELKEAAVGEDPTRQCDFVDLTLWVATNQVTNVVHNTGDQMIQIGLPFPDPKHCYVRVHRWHNDQVEQIPEGYDNRNTDGEYFTIDQKEGAVNGEVLLVVKNFSLYCISRGKEYATLRLYQPEHGTVELSLDPTFATTIADKFAPVWSETNVYVRCEANEGWIFQGFDAEGLKENDHITLSQKRDFTYDKGSGNWYWVPQFKFKETPAYSNATSKVVFDTLEELFNDPWTKPGDRVVLTRDETVEDPLEITKPIIFDGDGYTLKVAKPYVKEDGSIDPNATTGGVLVVDAGVSVTLTNMTVEGGVGAYAIENNGSLIVDDVTIKNSNGGITNAAAAKLLVRNSRLGRNVAGNGAAIENQGNKLVLVNTSFAENRATENGGAIASKGAIVGNNLVFTDNSAVLRGGAICAGDRGIALMNSTFGGNFVTTADKGGAIYIASNATVAQFANVVAVGNFVYDPTLETQTPNDIVSGSTATTNIACLYGTASGCTLVGCTEVTGTLYAGTVSGKRPYGESGVTAVLTELPATALKDAAEPLSRYIPLSDTATAYTDKGSESTTFGVNTNDFKTTFKGANPDFTLVDNAGAYAAPVADYYEGTVRSTKVPGASGTETPMAPRYTLRLKESPANGSVSGITLYGDAYTNDEQVVVAATADAGYYFLGWYDQADETTPESTDAIYAFAMPAANKVLVAKFGVLVPESGIWVKQESWIAGEEEAPAHTYGGKVGTGADEFEYAPKNNTSFWAIEKPVNAGAYYIKYIVREAPPYAESVVTNEFIVGGWVAFDALGGTFGDGSSTTNVLCPGSYVFPANPVRSGYTLLGWYDGITATANSIAADDPVSVDMVYAKWQANDVPGGGSSAGFTGTDTPDGQGVTDVKPTGKLSTGVVAIPERADNTATGKAIVSIADGAFTPKQYKDAFNAPAITQVSLPLFVTRIGNYAFYQNTALRNVTFSPVYDYKTGAPATLSIGNYAFAETAITNLVFPAGGSYTLGQLAFANNPNLKDVWLLGDITPDSLDNHPFREVGEAVGGTVFHLSPAKAADAAFVAALTNGLHMAQIATEDVTTVDEEPAGSVVIIGEPVVGATTIEVDFTVPANAPWKTVDETTVSLLFSTDPLRLVTASDCTKIPADSVVKQADGSYKATFPKPEGDTGMFRVCVGD